MRIAIVTPYLNYFGGVESVNSILKKILNELGHQVDFITSDDYEAKNIWERLVIKIVGLPYITSKRLKETNIIYDLIIANGEYGWGIKHKNCINFFHGSAKGYRNYLRKLWNNKTYLRLTLDSLIQRKSAKGKYVIAVSDFIKNILEKDNIIVNNVIPNCIDLNKFYPKRIEIKHDVLFVGTYNYYAKGFDILKQISKTNISVSCVTNLNPGNTINWIKNTSNDEMLKIYNSSRILVFPSRFESLGLVPLEAMACGLPVIVSSVGLGEKLKYTIPEFVVDDFNYKTYVDRLNLINSNYDFYSEKASEFVKKNHSLESYIKKWENLINNFKKND